MYHIINEREDANSAVAIRWDDLTHKVNLVVIDYVERAIYQMDVPNDKATDAFDHPYYYVLEKGGTVNGDNREHRAERQR